MADVAPDLLAKIQKLYQESVESDAELKRLRKLMGKEADYSLAHSYASRLSELLSKAYQSSLTPGTLPDETLYYNIAKRVLEPTLTTLYDDVSEVCIEVQQILNEEAHLGIKPQVASLNQDRINGIVNKVSGNPVEDVSWMLKSPVENFGLSVVDDHVRSNADFHYKAGLRPKIIRRTDGHCCKWCSDRAGVFDYSPNMNREVFRRHENCGCTVEYDPGDGSRRRQDVWTKAWSKAPDIPAKTPWQEATGVSYKSKADAIEYFRSVAGIEFQEGKRSTTQLDPTYATEIASWHSRFVNAFRGFDNAQGRDKLPIIKVLPKSKMGDGTLGYYRYYKKSRKPVEIALNAIECNSWNTAKMSVESSASSGWHSDSNPIHTFIHEYGHHVAGGLDQLNGVGFQERFVEETVKAYGQKIGVDTLHSYRQLSTRLSRYGTTTAAESFAEAFAEYFGSDSPRDYAKFFGERLEEELMKWK